MTFNHQKCGIKAGFKKVVRVGISSVILACYIFQKKNRRIAQYLRGEREECHMQYAGNMEASPTVLHTCKIWHETCNSFSLLTPHTCSLCVCVLLPLEKSFAFYISVVNSSRRNVLKEGLLLCSSLSPPPLSLVSIFLSLFPKILASWR